MGDMKLYAWQPKGHGEMSFFVMAGSEEQAKIAVQCRIDAELSKQDEDNYFSSMDFSGWGTDYYGLTVVTAGVVVMNSND